MAYLTPAQLIDGPGRLQELAELFELNLDLLRATIAPTDRTDWTAPELAAADAALVTIYREISTAGAEIDSRLVMRGYALPADPVAYPNLTVWARAIARYHLHPQRDRTDDGHSFRIERDYREALKTLDLIAAGKLGLGAGDVIASPLPSDAGSGPLAVAPGRLFDRASLADY